MSWTTNRPDVKLFLVAVSRNNFSRDLSDTALKALKAECDKAGFDTLMSNTLVETEQDAMAALAEAQSNACNGMAVLLGNFGPETPETLLAKFFDGPVMYAGASEDSLNRLYDGRRDSFCGLLNCSYNLNLRNCKAYIPDYPIGTPKEIAKCIGNFIPVARALIGVKHLKILEFGPRPSDFFACNAPIKGLYDLDIEIQENSELDLFLAFKKHEGDTRIPQVVEDMKRTVGDRYPDTLIRMAQYEVTLLDWFRDNRGASEYAVFANKCWPGFQQEFGFLPCYVHGRMREIGIAVACETDVYGALSEFIGNCIAEAPATLLDINNNIPDDLYDTLSAKYPYKKNELFIGFHCGNTPASLMSSCALKYKMNRKDPYAPETGRELTRGTLEGTMKGGAVCCYRLHAGPDGTLQAYIARGEILPEPLKGTYGVCALFGIHEMARFYRHVLIEKHYPHHSAVLYGNHGGDLFDIFRCLGVSDIEYNRPAGEGYPTENPFRRDWVKN